MTKVAKLFGKVLLATSLLASFTVVSLPTEKIAAAKKKESTPKEKIVYYKQQITKLEYEYAKIEVQKYRYAKSSPEYRAVLTKLQKNLNNQLYYQNLTYWGFWIN